MKTNETKKGEKNMLVDITERYINPYTDFGFKKLFGTELNKDLLISFLNALLNGEQEITDLTYLNSEHLGDGYSDRRAVFDVYCQLADGKKFIVEMQKAEQAYFKDRSIYYSKLTDVEDKHVFYDKLTFIYLEMPKFNKTEDELLTMFDKWMFALQNLSRLLERPKALQERIFTHLFEQAEIARFTPQERREYQESIKDYWDNYSIMETSFNKGKAEANRENARKMKELGISVEIISQVTGLTINEVDIL